MTGVFLIWAVYTLIRRRWKGRNRYVLEDFVVVEQKEAKSDRKVYSSMSSLLLQEITKIEKIHNRRTRQQLDEVSEKGITAVVSSTEAGQEIAGQFEQLQSLTAAGVSLPLGSLMGVFLRLVPRGKRVLGFYEELPTHPKRLRLTVEIEGEAAFSEEGSYADPLPLEASAASNDADGPHAAAPVQPLPDRPLVSGALLRKLAYNIAFHQRERAELRYSRSVETFEKFTCGLEAQQTAQDLERAGQKEAAQQLRAQANANYTAVLALQSDHTAALFSRAGLLLQDDKLEAAAKDYEEVVLCGDTFLRTASLYNLAQIHFLKHNCGSYLEALQYAERGIQIVKQAAPRGPACEVEESLLVGLICLAGALVALREKNCTGCRKQQVNLRQKFSGYLNEAKQHPTVNSKLPEFWRLTAKETLIAAEQTKQMADYEMALSLSRKAIVLQPDGAENYTAYGIILRAMYGSLDRGDPQREKIRGELLAVFEKARHLSSFGYFLMNLGTIKFAHFSQSQAGVDSAEKDLEKAFQEMKDSSIAAVNLALFLRYMKRSELRARGMAVGRALEDSQLVAARFEYVHYLLDMGREKEASRAWTWFKQEADALARAEVRKIENLERLIAIDTQIRSIKETVLKALSSASGKSILDWRQNGQLLTVGMVMRDLPLEQIRSALKQSFPGFSLNPEKIKAETAILTIVGEIFSELPDMGAHEKPASTGDVIPQVSGKMGGFEEPLSRSKVEQEVSKILTGLLKPTSPQKQAAPIKLGVTIAKLLKIENRSRAFFGLVSQEFPNLHLHGVRFHSGMRVQEVVDLAYKHQ